MGSCRWIDGECQAAGYPEFLVFDDGSKREHFVGELRPLAERGRIHAAGYWATERSPDQWCGMSGAGLFSD